MIRSLNHPEQFDFSRLDRRNFLGNTVVGLPFLLASSNLTLGRQQQHESFLSMLGKDSRMIVHKQPPRRSGNTTSAATHTATDTQKTPFRSEQSDIFRSTLFRVHGPATLETGIDRANWWQADCTGGGSSTTS